jgi:Zn-finger protein
MLDAIHALLSDEPLCRFVFCCFYMLEESAMDKATAKASGSNKHY